MPFLKVVALDLQTKAAIGDVTDAVDISFDSPHCTGGLPVLTLSARTRGRGVDVLETLPELQVQVYNGTRWIEPTNARFHVTGVTWQSNDTTANRQYSCLHVSRLMSLGRFGKGPGMTADNAWRTSAIGPGIIREFLEREKARGWWPTLTTDFTSTTDSAGKPWTQQRIREYAITDDFNGVLEAFANNGEAEYTYQGHTLRMFNPDTALAVDRSMSAIFRARASEDAPEKATLEGVFTTVLVKGEAGAVFEVVNPSANPSWGKTTTVIDSSGVTTQAQAQTQSAPTLFAAQDRREEYTRSFNVTTPGTPRPFIDYQVGDFVGIERNVNGKLIIEKARVMKVSLQGDTGHITLGTLVDGLLTRITNRLKPVAPVAGGDSTSRGPSEAALPAGFAPDAPRVTAFSEVYISQGYPLGRIRLQWAPITKGGFAKDFPNGTWYPVLDSTLTADCDQYRVEARRVGDDWTGITSGYQVIGEPVGGDFVHEGLTPGETWEYQVTAHQKGAEAWGWSYYAYPDGTNDPTLKLQPNTITVQVERDIIPPPAPTALATIAQWATVRLTWDGLAATGGTMPEDFVRVDIEARKKNTGNTWAKIGSITDPQGFYIHPNLTQGDIWEYRARAVDRSENKSEYSALSEVTVVSIESDPQYIADKQAALAASTVAFDLAKAAQAAATAVGEIDGKRFTMAATAPTATAGYPDGATWTQRDASGAQIAFWQLVGGAWVSRPLARVAIPAIDIGTGTFGDLNGGRLVAWSVAADRVLIGAGRNLVPNDGFESGVLPHTAAAGVLTQATSPVYHGSFSLCLATNPGASASSVLFGGSARTFKVKAGQKYRFKATVRVPFDVAQVTGLRLQMFYYDAAMTYIGTSPGAVQAPSASWVTIQEVFEVTLGAAEFVSPRLYVTSPAGHTGAKIYIDLVQLSEMETGELIVDGAVKAVHVAADAIEGRHIKVDVGLVNKLYADAAFIGAGRSQYWRTDMLDAIVLNTVKAKTASLEAAVINGADIFLTSATYASGKLQVRKTGGIEAIQMDAEGVHGLPDYRLGSRSWTLNMDNQLVFNTPGGTVRLTGVTADLNLVGNFLSNAQNVPALWWNTKHPAGVSRLRAPALTWHANPGEFRIDGIEFSGSVAGGVGISLAYQGDQDAVAIGNIYKAAGYMYRSNGGGASIAPGTSTWPRLEFTSNRAVFGVSAGQNVGFIDCSTTGTRIYASGEARGLNSNINIGTSVVTIDSITGTRIEKYLSVGGNIAASGTVSGSSKQFRRPHVMPEKAALGMVLAHAAPEAPVNGAMYWDYTNSGKIIIGPDGTTDVTLPDYVPYLVASHLSIHLTLRSDPGESPRIPWAEQTAPGRFRAHGPPGAQVSYLALGTRTDIAPLIPEEVDLDTALALNDFEPVSDAVTDALLTAVDAATTPEALATVAGALI